MSINFAYDPQPTSYKPPSLAYQPTFAPTTLSSHFRQPPAPIVSDPQKVRVTFNQSGYQQSFMRPVYTAPPVAVPVQAPVLVEPVAVREAVRQVSFETGELKSVKEGEFIGCFHCFSPVTYDTKAKKPLCG